MPGNPFGGNKINMLAKKYSHNIEMQCSDDDDNVGEIWHKYFVVQFGRHLLR